MAQMDVDSKPQPVGKSIKTLDNTKLRLTYFDVRGRSEPNHLLLVDSGVEFEDHRITTASWFDKHIPYNTGPKHGHPFGVLPVLNIPQPNGDSFTLSENLAILDYLEDRYAIDPKFCQRDALTRAKYNMIKNATFSFTTAFMGMLFRPEWEELTNLGTLKRDTIDPFLRLVSNQIFELAHPVEANKLGNKPAINLLHAEVKGSTEGTILSAAAATLFEAIELIQMFFPKALGKYPNLKDLHTRIAKRPRIAAYLKDDKRPNRITYSPLETPARIQAAIDAIKGADDKGALYE